MRETRNTVHMCNLTKTIKTQKLTQKMFASKIWNAEIYEKFNLKT